jgi:cell wall-associated NlpC family hydrolase
MKINIRFILLLVFFLESCGSFKTSERVIKTPFDKRDYPDTDVVFNVISSSIGTNINAIKSNAIAQAQASLSQRIQYSINSYLNLDLSNTNNTSSISSELKSITESNVFFNKIRIVDSRIFNRGDNKYEYWGVYSIKISDIVNIVNGLSKSFEINSEFYKSSIDENYVLQSKSKDIAILSYSADNIIEEAKKYLGVPYVWGGDSPSEGFDCSGYVQWVTNEVTGIFLPRTAKEQHIYLNQNNKDLKKINKGDIVFFNTNGSHVSHVGIALNNDEFIHSPNRNSKIRIDQFNGYWQEKFTSYAKIRNL